MVRSTRTFIVVAATVLSATAFSSVAADEHSEPAPTMVHGVHATADGTAVGVAADIEFGGQAPVVLGTDPVGDAPPQSTGHSAAFGLDLTEIRAYRADPAVPTVTLEWQATTLEQLPPPEVMRYYWQFLVNGAAPFAAQAKTSDVISAANLGDGEPTTIADNLASYTETGVPSFRLRGNCGVIPVGPTGVNNCGHVAWVDGEFDFEANVVRLELPVDLEAASVIRPGATLAPHDSGAYSAIQAGADLANTRDTVVQLSSYVIPDPAATAELLDADGAVVASAPLTRGEDGRWHGSVTAPGPGTYHVDVTGCFADNCGSAGHDVVVV